MAGTRHKLTTNADKIKGGTGSDLFLGSLSGPSHLPTLTSNDRLDGGKGVDTIRATLDDVATAPVMKNIERGIFSFTEASTIPLDLAKARQMHGLTMRSADGLDGAVVEIDHAAGVRSFSIRTESDQTFDLHGLSTKGTRLFQLSVAGEMNSTIDLATTSGATFTNLQITISDGAEVELSGNCINARNLIINSTASSGLVDNYVNINPGTHQGTVRNLTVKGDQNLTLYTQADTYLDLTSFNSSGMKAIVWAKLGGDGLTSVKGGNGTEIIDITDIGGTQNHKATVVLKGGHDDVTLLYAFDSATQLYNGGRGVDTITLDGEAANLNDAALNFENVHVKHAVGTYDVTGMKLVNFLVFSTSGVATIQGLADDATLGIYEDVTTFLTVNMAKAATSQTESLRVLLQNSADLGNSTAGFMAPSLSNLQIDCYSSTHTMYLASLGSASDAATLSITGSTYLTLNSSNASSIFIDTLTIDNDAGANIAALTMNGAVAFVSSGATITGGDGGDSLRGGAGADVISTGGGNNFVYSSAGADEIQFGTGINQLIVSAGHSLFGANHNTVTGIGSDDTIDLSIILSSIAFTGNFGTDAGGKASLSSAHASAYFNTAFDTLYVDLNHDQQINASDMQIELTGLNSFLGSMLVA